jgi:DNA mismatch repair protein MutL
VLPTITVLPPELASQIAAGEVVERPASVVKELVENSLDAGASRIDVTIEAGGMGVIEVADDGHGMHEVDARLCLERHATSKLRQLRDLEALGSYGFRGEALPSIASVSRLTLRTRTADSDEAVEVHVDGTAPARVRPAAAPVGTTLRVAELFFNVPARRKFLRSSGTEAGHVTEVLLDAALCRPEVTFTLTRDGRQVRNWPRTPGRDERVRQVFAEEELLVCQGERGPLQIHALLSRPDRARQGAGGLKILMNGRPIRDRALAGTVAHAYGSVLEKGRYPRGVVYLELPPHLVDVNVHPQKTEVRFADPRAVTDAVHGVVARELGAQLSGAPQRRPAPALWPEPRRAAHRVSPAAGTPPQDDALVAATGAARSGAAEPPTALSAPLFVADGGRALREGVRARHTAPAAGEAQTEPQAGLAPDASPAEPGRESLAAAPALRAPERSSQPAWSKLRFLHQVREMFLLCEGQEGLYVLDQHAAAERVVFSKLRRQYEERSVASQALLFPLMVEVTAQESEVLALHAEQIAAVGLDVRARTPEAVSIHAVPRLLERASPERLLRDLLTEVSRSGERAFSDAVDKALATMACHAAVRAGDPVTRAEALALLTALDDADFAAYCPHGRPIVAFTSWEELERKVGRR